MGYGKRSRKSILFFLLFFLLEILLFYLYDIKWEITIYLCVLGFFIGIGAFLSGFFLFIKKHKALLRLRENIGVSLENLEETPDPLEADYQELLKILYEQKNIEKHKFETKQSARTEYVTMWAHQIKSPIAAMGLLLQTEESDVSTELSQELFEMEQYVDTILQYLRLDSMHADFIISSFYMEDLVKQAVRTYAKVFVHKKMNLICEITNVRVLTDEKWVVFVIKQLLSNALKYTASGGTIRISQSPYNEKVLIFTDNGIGIAKEDIPRLFEQGFTGYNGHRDKKATGIGLYLCKKILDNLNHTIRIESLQGEGTQVFLDLSSTELYVE